MKPFYEDSLVRLLHGDVMDCLRSLPDNSVHCAVTSPPYFGLRSYLPEGHADKGKELGSEDLHDCAGWATGNKCGACFICRMVAVFAEVKRVLRPDASLWLNIGDSYNGSGGAGGDYAAGGLKEGQPKFGGRNVSTLKAKDLCLIPSRLALALQAEGWWVRSQIVWWKKSPMPESAQDRPTSSWEPIFLLTKSKTYFYDSEASREEGEGYGRSNWNAMQFKGGDVTRNHGGKGDHGRGGGTPTYEGGRNSRNVWHLGPDNYPEAHFATFVREIPRRAIRAGTSERGCCPACGAPWVRVVENEYTPSAKTRGKPGVGTFVESGAGNKSGGWNDYPSLDKQVITTGWQPTCTCNAGDPVPCTVLDPFLGSGTTAAVANSLGIYAIGIDLSAEYLDIAMQRTLQARLPLFMALVPERPAAPEAQQGSLFDKGARPS